MPPSVPYTVEYEGGVEEWRGDKSVTDVRISFGVTEINHWAFSFCTGLTGLEFLRGSGVTAVALEAFKRSGVTSLRGMEGVRRIGFGAFIECWDLVTIEGLNCEEMGEYCFALCILLRSMKGWPACMTHVPTNTFAGNTGMTAVDCDLSRVTSIGQDAFAGCLGLLPPDLAEDGADPAAVLAYLKKKAFNEKAPLRYAVYASVRRARDQEEEPRTDESPDERAFAMARLPPDMNRVIVEFLYGAFVRQAVVL
ncbi:hypothetical protein TeGR_g5979 [Tetraparma gracilis]|uniref:Uncharacterized protein n=1 Tax=Tetraparma gracilis TaxID=2962635 RepID=A0ABQ6MWJ7_9STRA|nr:hypothetical protein TeGR_g5979 [Tetraparma gracilis]